MPLDPLGISSLAVLFCNWKVVTKYPGSTPGAQQIYNDTDINFGGMEGIFFIKRDKYIILIII